MAPMRILSPLLGFLLALPFALPAAASPRPRRPAGTGGRLPAAQRDAVLREHNRARAAVSVKPLRWSDALSDYAQAWAGHLAATSCELHHRKELKRMDGNAYGENLAASGQDGGPFKWDPVEGVRGWIAEKQDYPGGPFTEAMHSAGHYTQLVWSRSRRVGCGMAACRKGGWDWWILVCNYDPPGNFLGERPYR